MTADLVAWLTQILDEDEVRLKRLVSAHWWHLTGDSVTVTSTAMADIAAKRAIIAWCTERDRVWVGTFGADPTDPQNYVPGGLTHRTESPVLRLLASAYADRPGYLDEWRP